MRRTAEARKRARGRAAALAPAVVVAMTLLFQGESPRAQEATGGPAADSVAADSLAGAAASAPNDSLAAKDDSLASPAASAPGRDFLEAAGDSTSAPDSLAAAAQTAGPDSLDRAPKKAPRPPLFAAYGALDAMRADAVLAREDGITRGARTPIEPLREAPGVALERFGFLGQSERLLILGAEGVSLRIAGLPVLASRSGLAPLGLIPSVPLRSARLRRPESDPLLGARGAAGSVDALVAPETEPDSPPLTTLLAERGPFEFRAYRVGLDRWLGPIRASVGLQTTRNRLFDEIDHTRLRETFVTIVTPEEAAVPLLVGVGAVRNEIDIVSGEGAASGPRRGTEERSLVIARSGFLSPILGRVRVALKDDRVEWRARTEPGVFGRERESGGLVSLERPGAGPPLALAMWGYFGRVVDEGVGRARGAERVGATAVAGEAAAIDWTVYAGAERTSPNAPELLAGAKAGHAFGAVRVEASAYRAPDHPPRGLFLEGDALRAARTAGASLTLAVGEAAAGSAASTGSAPLETPDAPAAPDVSAAPETALVPPGAEGENAAALDSAAAQADSARTPTAPAESRARRRASLTFLHRWVDDGIFLNASDPFFANPIRATYHDRGVLAEIALPLLVGVGLEADYLFLDDDAGTPLPLRARHRGRAGLARTWSFPERDIRLALRAGCEIVWDRLAFDRSTPLDAAIDLRGQIRLEIETAVLFLQAENLLDRFNAVLPGLYPESQAIHLGVTWLLRD